MDMPFSSAISTRIERRSNRLLLYTLIMLVGACLALANPLVAHAQYSIVEEYFIPLPENDLFAAFDTINSAATSPVQTAVSIAIGGNTIIVYDQWENGYDASLASPLNIYSSGEAGCPPANLGGTQIWGNGNRCDGDTA